MTEIACPLCLGPTQIAPDGGACEEGHSFDHDEMVGALQARADNALWTAIRVLDDQAAYGRHLERAGLPVPPHVAHAEEHGAFLREFIRTRKVP